MSTTCRASTRTSTSPTRSSPSSPDPAPRLPSGADEQLETHGEARRAEEGFIRVLGIDPGSTATGYGVVERTGSRVVHVAHGVLRPPRGADLAQRLAAVSAGLADVIAAHAPTAAVVERVFVAVNPRSALVLGQARGAALAALAGAGLVVSERAASEIKRAVTGHGAAEKQQVQTMVRQLLALDRVPPRDAADALAAALCHAQAGPLAALAEAAPARGKRRGAARSRGGNLVVRRRR